MWPCISLATEGAKNVSWPAATIRVGRSIVSRTSSLNVGPLSNESRSFFRTDTGLDAHLTLQVLATDDRVKLLFHVCVRLGPVVVDVIGARQHGHGSDPIGKIYEQVQPRDRAHAVADDVGPVDAKVIQQSHGVEREPSVGDRTGAIRRPAVAAAVREDDPEIARQLSHVVGRPRASNRPTAAMDEQNRLSGALDLVVQLHVANWREPGDRGGSRLGSDRCRQVLLAGLRAGSHTKDDEAPGEGD